MDLNNPLEVQKKMNTSFICPENENCIACD